MDEKRPIHSMLGDEIYLHNDFINNIFYIAYED